MALDQYVALRDLSVALYDDDGELKRDDDGRIVTVDVKRGDLLPDEVEFRSPQHVKDLIDGGHIATHKRGRGRKPRISGARMAEPIPDNQAVAAPPGEATGAPLDPTLSEQAAAGLAPSDNPAEDWTVQGTNPEVDPDGASEQLYRDGDPRGVESHPTR